MENLTRVVGNTAKATLFLQTLKKSTAEQHVLLESNALLSAIMTPEVTVRQYYYYLVLMQKVSQAYETNVLPVLETLFRESERRKASPLIEEDLQNIAQVLPPDSIGRDLILPPGIMPVPFALGFMYVMEGSKLGGRVIFKHIQRRLGFSGEHGAKYIADQGADTIGLWKEFLAILSRYVVENDCEEETIHGAKYAFTAINDFFESNRSLYES